MDKFEEKLRASWSPSSWGRFRMVLGLSGGGDSVALLAAFARNADPDQLLALHVNHGLRGEESEEDARFAARLAERYGVRFREERIKPEELRIEERKEGSLEAGARTVRYRLLLKNAESFGARYILTAHHADDQVETILYRLFRGSGIDGLTGMSRFRRLNEAVVLARPFLFMTRFEIEEYLFRINETWRTDSSNLSPAFLRNRIRNELIPLLDDLFPGKVNRSVLRLSSHAGEMRDFLHRDLELLITSKGIPSPESFSSQKMPISIPISPFRGVPQLLLKAWLRRLWVSHRWSMGGMDAERWQILAELICRGLPVSREFPGGIRIRIEEGVLIIATVSDSLTR